MLPSPHSKFKKEHQSIISTQHTHTTPIIHHPEIQHHLTHLPHIPILPSQNLSLYHILSIELIVPIKMSPTFVKSITLLSTVLLVSAQLSTLPRRLRRGSLTAVEQSNELDFAAEEKEFGRERQLENFSLSMSMSLSVDLEPAGMDFSELDTASMPVDEESSPTYQPSYWPTYYPSTSPVDPSPTAVSGISCSWVII
jgi:hypothetical protein